MFHNISFFTWFVGQWMTNQPLLLKAFSRRRKFAFSRSPDPPFFSSK